jgi:hypothetical protein
MISSSSIPDQPKSYSSNSIDQLWRSRSSKATVSISFGEAEAVSSSSIQGHASGAHVWTKTQVIHAIAEIDSSSRS